MMFRSRHKGFGLADVVFATVILTTIVFGALRLYADMTRQKVARLRSQEAETVLLNLHEREKPRLFSHSLGAVTIPPVDIEGRVYNVSMEISEVSGHPDDQLRSVEYKARYEIRGVDKTRTIVMRAHQLD